MYNKEEFENFLIIMEEIEFTWQEKNKIKSLNESELMNKVFLKTKNHIMSKTFTGEFSIDFIKWAIYTIWFLKWIFK